jgi:hypothetical protein
MSMPRPHPLVLGGALVVLTLVFPTTAAATITGGCTGEGHSTSSSSDLTNDTIWHLKRDDVAGGSGTSPASMRSASVSAYGLGIPIPIAGGTSQEGKTEGSVDGVQVSTYAVLGREFVVAGTATGDAQCTGQIEIVIDDVQAVFTVFGGGGLLVGILALLGMLLLARGGRGFGNRIVSAFLGVLAGVGLGLAAEQFGVLDPTQPIGLVLVVALAVLGFVTAGLLGPRGTSTVASA